MSLQIRQDEEAFAYVDNGGTVWVDTVSSTPQKAMINAMLTVFKIQVPYDMSPGRIEAHWNLLCSDRGTISRVACIPYKEDSHDQPSG